jgi:hypothetical protein
MVKPLSPSFLSFFSNSFLLKSFLYIPFFCFFFGIITSLKFKELDHFFVWCTNGSSKSQSLNRVRCSSCIYIYDKLGSCIYVIIIASFRLSFKLLQVGNLSRCTGNLLVLFPCRLFLALLNLLLLKR